MGNAAINFELTALGGHRPLAAVEAMLLGKGTEVATGGDNGFVKVIDASTEEVAKIALIEGAEALTVSTFAKPEIGGGLGYMAGSALSGLCPD